VKKIFFSFVLLSIFLLIGLFIRGKERPYKTNTQGMRQEISNRSENLEEFDGKRGSVGKSDQEPN